MELVQRLFPAFFAKNNLVLCIAAILIRVCDAQHLTCNVTQLLHGTLYSVPQVAATQCSYSWMNSTGHVLANEKGQMDQLVLNSSIRTLVSRTCRAQLNYTRDCVSEGIQHAAYCLADCMTPEPLKNEETHRQHWVIAVSVAVLALLICSVLKRRNNPLSTDVGDQAQDIRNIQEI